MSKTILNIAAIILSSIFTILIVGPFKSYIQPTLLVLTLLDLGLFTKYASTKDNKLLQRIYELGILLSSTLLVETLILSSGGIYGPFFILTYLFALGLGLFVGLMSSVIFLISMVGLIVWQIYSNPQIGQMFKDDPWLGVLYGASMFVVVPLMHYLTKTYHLKDNLAEKLKLYLQTSTKREASILESLNEIVIVTNPSLVVISVNEATEKILKTDEAALQNKIFFDAINLTDAEGKTADSQGLLIDNIVRDKASRIIEGYFLSFPDKTRPSKVRIQVRPVVDPGGNIAQLIFVITEETTGEGDTQHSDLKQAEEKTERIENELEKELFSKSPLSEQIKFDALNLAQKDIRLVQDLADHPINKNNQIESLALIASQSVDSIQKLTQLMKIPINLNLPESDVALEKSYQELKASSGSGFQAVASAFSLAIDQRYFALLVESLIRLHLVLTPDPAFGVTINLSRSEDQIKFEWISHPANVTGTSINQLFDQYYPNIPQSANSVYSSGLEGFIAATIAKQMEISLESEFIESAGMLKITARINKTLSPN